MALLAGPASAQGQAPSAPKSLAVTASADPVAAVGDSSSTPAVDPRTPVRAQRMLIPVVMDQALIIRVPETVKTMILGNPQIADVASESKGIMIVTGKAFGSTNLVLVDEQGKIIGESLIQVMPARAGVVTVQRGDHKEAYSCTPRCVPTSTGAAAAMSPSGPGPR